MSLLLGRFDLMIPFVCFKEQHRTTKETEHIFAVSSLGESVQEGMSVHTAMRCLKQENCPSRTLKTVTTGKQTTVFHFFYYKFDNDKLPLSFLLLYHPAELCYYISLWD